MLALAVLVGLFNGASQVGALPPATERVGGFTVAPWPQGRKRIGEEQLAEILGLKKKAPEQVTALIVDQSKKVRESREAQEADLEAAFRAKNLEYNVLYARILELEIQKMQDEEESVAMCMMALL